MSFSPLVMIMSLGSCPQYLLKAMCSSSEIYRFMLLCQFRPMSLRRLMCLLKLKCVHKLTCHLNLLYVVEEIHLPEEIMKS